MTSSKQAILAICPERLRQVPAQFSWVDQRLVRDRHLDHLDAQAAARYLFLVTVADAQGLSWYGEDSTARRRSIDAARLRRARGDLVRAGLLAYARPLYQVLALADPVPALAAPRRPTANSVELSPLLVAPTTDEAVLRARLVALHNALARPV